MNSASQSNLNDESQPPANSSGMEELFVCAQKGESSSIARLFSAYEGRLSTVLRLRMDPRLKGRIDTADVLQEAYIEFERRFQRDAPSIFDDFYLWIRSISLQKLIDLSRHHLGAKKRSVKLEVSLRLPTPIHASSMALEITASQSSPSQKASRNEDFESLHLALDDMGEQDREILALRHFEELSNEQSAKLLEISKSAASNRYVRALQRLEQALRAVDLNSEESP